MDTPQSPSSPQKFNYWREACKSLPGLLQNFDQPPSDRPPPIPCVLLDLPQSDSSTSREPSPVSTSTNNSHRRYLPRTRERRTVRRNFDDELQLSQSVEEFGFLEGSGRRAQRASSDTDEQPARWTSPIRAFSSSSSQNRGVYRKLSIRRRQPLTVMANFDDVVCYSGDELERKNSRSALAVHSGSLPSIVQATTISTDDVEWKPSNAEPPLISPILSVDPINHKPVQLSSDENGNDELNNHHESEVDSPFSNPPEPPTSAPAFTENGTVFAFERRRSLVQELPAISEDPPECNVVPTETMQFRSTSDRALDSKNDDTDENKRRSMIIITGNPNHVDDDPPLLSTPKSKSTTAIGGAPCHLVRSTNRHTIDRIDTRAHSPEYANGGILRQDDSKTLHFVEPTQRRSQIQNDDDLKSTSPSPPTYSPELNQRKIRLQRRKTVGPKKKTIQARRAPVDDIIHPSLIEDAAAEEEEEEAVGHISIIRSVSSFGFSNGDKEKKREGVISALLSVRQNKRKPSRASLHDTGSIVSTDRSKRRSLIEHTGNFLSNRSLRGVYCKSTGDLHELGSFDLPDYPKAKRSSRSARPHSILITTPTTQPVQTSNDANNERQNNRRSTTIIHFSSTKKQSAGRTLGSLANVREFHASFNQKFNNTDKSNQQKTKPHRRPPLLGDHSFTSLSSTSSSDEPIEEAIFVPNGVPLKRDSGCLESIPEWRVEPASPLIERSAPKWSLPQPIKPTNQKPPFRKMSEVTRLSTDDEDYDGVGVRKRSFSKSPTRIPDQVFLEKIASPPASSEAKRLSDFNVSPTSSLKGFGRWPSLRRRSWKQKVDSTFGETFGSAPDSLPDALAYALSAPSENDLRNVQQNGVNGIQWPQLNKKKWEDLCIWNEDPANWSTQNSKVEISAGEEKRQNVIYEFYTTEKRHCQTLIFLQQVFQVGFIHHNILSETETKLLIPDVIDSLLDFHLNLLRRIRQRILAGPIVRTISDIVCEEFKNGEHRAAATKAYTNFTLAHGEADSRYNDYMKKNPQFNAFCKNLDQYPKSKERNFKSCYLLITQRLTHYPTFITRLIKCETCGELKNLSQNALRATENFALQVNNDLSSILLNRRFDHVCSIMDRTSVGKVLGQRFAFEDLMLNGIERKIYSIGNVWFEIPQQSIELTLLLFDDVLVFLQSKNNQLHFFSHKNQASVLPLSTLLIREMPRSNELMLIEPMTPDMCQLKFNNRSDMNQWMQALKDAQAMAPKFVRLSNRKMKIEGKLGQNVDRNTEVSEESKYNEELQKWEDRLDEIFLSRINKESKLKLYMEERMAFMDDLRSHLLNFPNSTNFDFNSSSSSKTRELTKMKTLLNTHFCDLRAFRRTALDKLVERAQKFRDSDISSFFDDLQELYHPNSSDSTALSSSSNDENPEKPSTSANCRKPRRSKTWNYGNAESIYQKEGVRRHTTMPKMQSFAHHPLIEEDGEDVRLDKQLQRLPVNLNSKTRRVATEIILENLRLRDQNDQLREENARNAMHLAAIRARKTPFAETTEKLESLRQKQEEVQNKEVTFRRECEKRLDELRQWEEELRSRENELVERTQTLNDERSGPPDSANSSGISRDTSFRGGAVILDQRQSSPSTTMNKPQNSVEKTVPKHLAESKPKRRTKN
ncbi:DH domain-containing protein [Aphelenchoides besseyi]|nr:DH domain-containing protein [Aphelenchoides besseyi]